MRSSFSIDYEIARVDCSTIRMNPDNGDYEGFMLNAVEGEAILRCGGPTVMVFKNGAVAAQRAGASDAQS